MRKIIQEMPIKVHNINVNTKDEISSFNKDDRGILNSPKALDKIKRIWRSSVADVVLYTFDIKQDTNDALNLALFGDRNKAPELDSIYDAPTMVPFDPNAINLILTTNEGAERYPITGWMLAHRLFHAFQSDRHTDFHQAARIDGSYSPYQITDQMFEQLGGVQFDLENYRVSNGYSEVNLLKVDLSHLMGTTKACREFKLTNSAELLPECFAQYMLRGKVTLRPLPAGRFKASDGRIYNPIPETDMRFCNHVVESFENFLNRYCSTLIEKAKGRIVSL